mmetsp:Transcript_52326/g.111440  ORF Transcript_52326/g.111440 Transcript_52326/m.111440 type:complete len:117 (+) Transcript_52326:116-466(+)
MMAIIASCMTTADDHLESERQPAPGPWLTHTSKSKKTTATKNDTPLLGEPRASRRHKWLQEGQERHACHLHPGRCRRKRILVVVMVVVEDPSTSKRQKQGEYRHNSLFTVVSSEQN